MEKKGDNFIPISVHSDSVPVSKENGEWGYFILFMVIAQALLFLFDFYLFIYLAVPES